MRKTTSNSSIKRGISTRLNSKKKDDKLNDLQFSSRISNTTCSPKKIQKDEPSRPQKTTYDRLCYQIKSPTKSTRITKSSDLQINAKQPNTQQKSSRSTNFSNIYLKNETTYKNRQNNQGPSSKSSNNIKKSDYRPATQRSYSSLHKTQQYSFSFGKSSFNEEKRTPTTSRIANKKTIAGKSSQESISLSKQQRQTAVVDEKKNANTKYKEDEKIKNKELIDDEVITKKSKNEISQNLKKNEFLKESKIIKEDKIKDDNIKLEKNSNDANTTIAKSNAILTTSYSPEFTPIFVNQRPPLTQLPAGAVSVDFEFFQKMMTQIQKSILELQKKFDDKICNIQKKIAFIEFSVLELQK